MHSELGSADPHIWLSPRLVKQQAQNVLNALVEADPAHKEQYRSNMAEFSAELDSLDARIRSALAPYRGRTVFVFHPAFGYFMAEYALVQQAVERGGRSPTPKELSRLIAKARAENAAAIFVQPQFDTRSAEVVADAIGGAVVAIDPLARDLLKNFEVMAEAVAGALGGGREGADR